MNYKKIDQINIGVSEIKAAQTKENLLPAKVALKVHKVFKSIEPFLEEIQVARDALLKEGKPDIKEKWEELLNTEIDYKDPGVKITPTELGEFKFPIDCFNYLEDFIDAS